MKLSRRGFFSGIAAMFAAVLGQKYLPAEAAFPMAATEAAWTPTVTLPDGFSGTITVSGKYFAVEPSTFTLMSPQKNYYDDYIEFMYNGKKWIRTRPTDLTV